MSTKSVQPQAPEHEYGREVFERLRQRMDFVERVGSDGRDVVIAMTDDYIAPNYEIREDGVYLKHDQELDSLNWLPACDLDGQDALSAPALPIPFTARHFAAFVLGGWGWHLGQRFGMPCHDLDDDDAVRHLGGVRDAAARKAVLAGRKLLLQARANVANTDPTWENAKRDFEAAKDEQSKHATAPAELLAVLAAAHTAMSDAEPTWRKAMVRVLLEPVALAPAAHVNVNELDPAPRQVRPQSIATGNTKAIRMAGGGRADLLTPLIENAVAEVGDEASQVFTLLREWAKAKRDPLFGVTELGLQWTDANDEPRDLSRKALGDRLRRLRGKAR
jgi:hypothetical protein